MDIGLLSSMIVTLLRDRDSLTLPGLGSFVTETVGSTFSDKGYTVNPPYRRLSFSSKEGADTALIDLYRQNNDVDYASADRIVKEFIGTLEMQLLTKRLVVFPGLGRLRATRENHLFFVAEEELDIFPEGFGLERVSLKTHEETPEEAEPAEGKKSFRWLLWTAAGIAAVIVVFMIVGRVWPDLVDPFLYNDEELEILKTCLRR